MKDGTRPYSQLPDLITTAPSTIRDELIRLSPTAEVNKTLLLRPGPTRLHEPTHATRHALRALARRIRALETEIGEADKILTALQASTCPSLLRMPQVGPQIAA